MAICRVASSPGLFRVQVKAELPHASAWKWATGYPLKQCGPGGWPGPHLFLKRVSGLKRQPRAFGEGGPESPFLILFPACSEIVFFWNFAFYSLTIRVRFPACGPRSACLQVGGQEFCIRGEFSKETLRIHKRVSHYSAIRSRQNLFPSFADAVTSSSTGHGSRNIGNHRLQHPHAPGQRRG